MNILVCLKQVLDPEIPARDFAVDAAKREALRGSHNLVMDIFCANALETALQFREKNAGTTIAVLAAGPTTAEDVLRKALAHQADSATLIVREDVARADPLAAARILAAGIRKRGGVDLVMAGRESADWGHGQTGSLLAEELGWPCIGFVDQLEPIPGGIRVRRQTDQGWEMLEASLPLVVTITNNDRNVPRIPKTRDVMQSGRKPLTKWTLADLGLTVDQLQKDAAVEVAELVIPVKESKCEFIKGDTLEERIAAFADRIRQAVHSA